MAKALRRKTYIHTGDLQCPYGLTVVRVFTFGHINSIFISKADLKKSAWIKPCRKSMKAVKHVLLKMLR